MSIDARNFWKFCESNNFRVRVYAGRWMYGKHCLAVYFDSTNDERIFLHHLYREFGDEGDKLIASSEFDSMGTGTIIYWPRYLSVDEAFIKSVQVEA